MNDDARQTLPRFANVDRAGPTRMVVTMCHDLCNR